MNFKRACADGAFVRALCVAFNAGALVALPLKTRSPFGLASPLGAQGEMNEPSPTQPDSSHGDEWRKHLSAEWQWQILADDEDFDLELIGAFAEGNVTDAERREAERIIAASPAALDLLVTLREQSDEVYQQTEENHQVQAAGRPMQAVGSDSRSTTIETYPSGERPTSPPGDAATTAAQTTSRSISRMPSMVAAASVVIAVGAIGWSLSLFNRANQLGQEIAALDQRMLSQAETLTLSQREQLLLTSSTPSPHFFAGPESRRLFESALADDGSRGRGNEIPEVRTLREDTMAAARRSLAEWQRITQNEVGPDLLIARASLEITAGTLDDADATIDRLAARLGEEAAEVRNLRAGRLLALAETQTLSEGDQTRSAARDQLELLTQDDPEFANGWLNLALLLQRTAGRDNPATRTAWAGYLRADRVPEEFRQALQKHLDEAP